MAMKTFSFSFCCSQVSVSSCGSFQTDLYMIGNKFAGNGALYHIVTTCESHASDATVGFASTYAGVRMYKATLILGELESRSN
jgi:hypothetical protein